MKFSIGALVVEKSHLRAHTNYSIHKVVAFLDGALLLTWYGDGFDGEIHAHEMDDILGEPGSRSWREGIHRYQEEELITPEEALIEIHRLEDEKDKLSQEFESVQLQIQDKLAEAANLVSEAAQIAKACDKDFYDLKQECMPLYRALDDGGWSHSHMRC